MIEEVSGLCFGFHKSVDWGAPCLFFFCSFCHSTPLPLAVPFPPWQWVCVCGRGGVCLSGIPRDSPDLHQVITSAVSAWSLLCSRTGLFLYTWWLMLYRCWLLLAACFSGFIMILFLALPGIGLQVRHPPRAAAPLTIRLCYHRSTIRLSYLDSNLLSQNVPIRPFNHHIMINIYQLETKPGSERLWGQF